MATIERPHGTTLAALKGIAITASLLTAGQLGTISITLPSLYPAAQTSHRLAAQQFKHLYNTAKATGPPAELLTTIICGGLAYIGYASDNAQSGKWKLWAAASASMFAVVPFTITLMEGISYKLLWVSEVASSATTVAGPVSTGIGVKVTSATPNGGDVKKANGSLGLPGGAGGKRNGAITPMEEFEPFEDAPMDPQEYEQLKVIRLLKRYNSLNWVRTMGPLAAGALGLWATLTE